MKRYYTDDRNNKAAMLLAGMSTDMVEDIVNLIQQQGRTVIATVKDTDGPPAPMAVLSRDFISDADFPKVYYGIQTVFLSGIRRAAFDNDYYQKVLASAFGLPAAWARVAAKQIETQDVLGGASQVKSWVARANNTIQETIRQGANAGAAFLQLPWYNDQNQKFDHDVLYEMALLGDTVDKMNARARLMNAASLMTAATGLFALGDAEDEFGDVDDYGDAEGEMELGEAVAPLLGAKLPSKAFGGSAPLAAVGEASSKTKVHELAGQAGLVKGKQPSQRKGLGLQKAFGKIGNLNPGIALGLGAAAMFTPFLFKAIKALVAGAKAKRATGDVDAEIRDQYGDVAGDLYKAGDLSGLLSHIIDLAGMDVSTGDAELDELIIGDVDEEILGEIEEAGDAEGAYDPEIGGLFRRARISAALSKGNRRQRKARRKAARMARRNAESQSLSDAQAFASANPQAEYYMPEDTGQFSAGTGLSPNTYGMSGSDLSPSGEDPYSLVQFNGNQSMI